jgi:tRNA 2-selenouridine synthase
MSVSLQEFLLLRADHPVVDVRSQGEFAAGHIPGAFNVPLLNDAERIVVGTTYKQQGQKQAISEGFRLVGPRLHQILNEAEAIAAGRPMLVHCWRGGMRSSNFCQFAKMAGLKSEILEGGYKTYRQQALSYFQTPLKLLLLTGLTGSGKSDILRQLASRGQQVLDLEMLARHKGSVFGGMMMPPQPLTEQFHNDLFEELMKLDHTKPVWVEDESLAIGKVYLPASFWTQMMTAQLIKIDLTKSKRVERLVREYGKANKNEFLEMMTKIVRKLGGQHYLLAKEMLLKDDMSSTIDILLTYYDKAYQQSIGKRRDQLIQTLEWDGNNINEVVEHLLETKPIVK